MALRKGTTVTAPVRIQDDTIPEPVAFASEIQGGVHSVDTLALRNSMPAHFRVFGMLCSVIADPTPANNKIYRLWPNIDSDKNNNANWESLAALTTPNLQAVTDAGAVSNDAIEVAGLTNKGPLLTGHDHTATHRGSALFGFNGLSQHPGEKVLSVPGFANTGDAQKSEFLGKKDTTTSGIVQVVFGDATSNVSAITINLYSLNLIRMDYIGVTDAGEYITGSKRYVVRMDDTFATLTANLVVSESTYMSGSWPGAGYSASITPDITNGTLKVDVEGAAATNIRWLVSITKQSLIYVEP